MSNQEFYKIIKDFFNDLLNTFPELKPQIEEINFDDNTLFEYCKSVFPERFFDILYQNEDIFKNEDIQTMFLPNIEFKYLWKQDITEKTRLIMWKYLQLILFSIVGSETKGDSFGETAKFFEAIDDNEFKKKLEETISQMSTLFDSSQNTQTIPDANELHNHITGILDGQLGKLATEIAEETSEELNLDLDNVHSMGDVFQQLFKNPGKLMHIVKKVGTKLDNKLQSGDLKESELMKEASELMKKMGNIPGMGNINHLFGKMGVPIGKNKINQNAFQAHMERNIRNAQMRERLQRKLELRQKNAEKMKLMEKKEKKENKKRKKRKKKKKK